MMVFWKLHGAVYVFENQEMTVCKSDWIMKVDELNHLDLAAMREPL